VTLQEAPPIPASAPETSPQGAPEPQPWTLRLFMRQHPWWSVSVAVVLFSVVLVYWAGTRPGFDPYGWLVWGHQTVTGSLDTNAAPSWKPLSYIFAVPYALAGHRLELRLWMFTAAAVALAGSVFAGRIAYRLTLDGVRGDRRWPAVAAAVFAGLALLGLQDYFHYILSSQSDPMIVTLCLAAIDCHLYRRYRAAFVLGVLAALGRPEVWPFLFLYSIWLWRALPSARWLLGGGWAVVVVLWFGIPALTSRSPFVAATNAVGSGRRLKSDQIFGTMGRFTGINVLPVQLAALVALAIAVVRRNWVIVGLAVGVALWVVVEIAFALHGWPGLARYMFEAAGVVVVLAGVGVGWMLQLRSLWPRWPSWTGWAGVALVVVLVASVLPSAVSHARAEHKDLREQRLRTAQINRLQAAVTALGGAARLRQCGEPLTRLEYQTILAYTLGENVVRVGFKYGQAIAHGNPIVMYTPTSHGWVVQAMHQVSPVCRSLPH
jgi:hypothetical protein